MVSLADGAPAANKLLLECIALTGWSRKRKIARLDPFVLADFTSSGNMARKGRAVRAVNVPSVGRGETQARPLIYIGKNTPSRRQSKPFFRDFRMTENSH